MTDDLTRKNEITDMRNEFVDLAAGIGSAVVACIDPATGLITAPLFATGLKSMFGESCSVNMEDVLRRQGERLEKLEQGQQQSVLERLQSPKGMEFQHQVCWHGLNAFTNERRDRIAQLATKGLSGRDDDLTKADHFLRIHPQLGDEDIAVLVDALIWKTKNPKATGEQIRDRLESVRPIPLEVSRRQLLFAFGLLHHDGDNDFFLGQQTPLHISTLGEEFLVFVGLN